MELYALKTSSEPKVNQKFKFGFIKNAITESNRKVKFEVNNWKEIIYNRNDIKYFEVELGYDQSHEELLPNIITLDVSFKAFDIECVELFENNKIQFYRKIPIKVTNEDLQSQYYILLFPEVESIDFERSNVILKPDGSLVTIGKSYLDSDLVFTNKTFFEGIRQVGFTPTLLYCDLKTKETIETANLTGVYFKKVGE